MTGTRMTTEEMSLSLTGFDEIAIEKHFDLDIYYDAETKGVKTLRALVFVALTREGLDASEAKAQAMGMPLGVLQNFFSDDEEFDPEEPVTESGKDSAPPA